MTIEKMTREWYLRSMKRAEELEADHDLVVGRPAKTRRTNERTETTMAETQTQIPTSTEPTTSSEPYEGLPPDGAEFAGKIVSVGPLEEVGEKKTPFRNVTFLVADDGPYKGRRYTWTAWYTEEAAVRTFQTFLGSGCTFPNGDEENFEGLGSREQVAVLEREPPYTPEPTEENPIPRTIYRVRIKWINQAPQGMRGEAISDGRKAVLKPMFQGALARARAGKFASPGPDAQGNVVQSGTLRGPDGKVKF